MKILFQVVEHMFQALEFILQDLEHKFQVLVQQIYLGRKTFSSGGKKKSPETRKGNLTFSVECVSR